LPAKEGETKMRQRQKPFWIPTIVGLGFFSVVFLVVFQARQGYGIPAFARKYQTSCSTCHSDPPELNDFGWAFKKNGFKFPKDDADFVKQPQLKLGAPAYKKIFPKAIYPGEIPGSIPIAFRYEGYLNYANRQPQALGFQPRVDLFAPDTFTIIAAGSMGDNLSFWIDDDVAVGGSGADGGLGDGYLKYNDLGHHLGLPKDALNVRVGQFELDLPFTQARTINLSDYDVYDEESIAGSLGTTDNPFTLGEVQRGIEFGGYPNDGNFNWSVALTDGSNDNVPSSNGKNVYINVFQQFNLDKDHSQRREVQAAGPTGPHDHTSIRVGAFYDYGRNSLNTDGTLFPGFAAIDEPYYRVGSYFRFKYQSRFELYGMGMYSHDDNLIPNDTTMSVDRGPAINYSGGFVEAEYWAYPWLIPIMRYDVVNAPFDYYNGVSKGFTRNRFSPGVQMLIRPNVKFAFEYTHLWAEPIPGETTFFNPNGFQGGIDFAF
jgi:hypothetical protein